MKISDMEDAMKAHAEMIAAQPPPEPLPVTEETARFCPISLGDWLEIAEKAGVRYVPAEKVTTFNRRDVLMFDTKCDEGEAVRQRLMKVFDDMERAREYNHMMRFDCCAGDDTKYRMSEGMWEWHEEHATLYIGTLRAFDIMMEYPREEIPVWQRPWVEAEIVDSYPVEYRVFVRDGKVIGVSNYYPQRLCGRISVNLSECVRRHTTSSSISTRRFSGISSVCARSRP